MASVALLLLAVLPVHGLFDQYVNVTGRLTCHGQPLKNVTVVLGDYDFPDANDILAETETDKEGRYELSGQHDEFFSIQPFLAIAHTCKTHPKEVLECLHIVYMNLPQSVVSLFPGANQTKVADLELGAKRENQKTYCGNNVSDLVLRPH